VVKFGGRIYEKVGIVVVFIVDNLLFCSTKEGMNRLDSLP
ncbi:MAG: hypothetical protein ACI8VT_002806, partial [Saprospiraceae bacterium]